ncbi:hypothetical protein KM043_010239 [Ampulex compressa]|nr:hypothetical protein KM043_010239 [Ampulex compressa]
MKVEELDSWFEEKKLDSRLEVAGLTMSNVETVSDGAHNASQTAKRTRIVGCLDAITLDLMWITAYILGLCFMAILAEILAFLSDKQPNPSPTIIASESNSKEEDDVTCHFSASLINTSKKQA